MSWCEPMSWTDYDAHTSVRAISGELCSLGCTPVGREKVYRLLIESGQRRESVYLSPTMQGLRLDVSTGAPVSIWPVLECHLEAMELPVATSCDRCGGTLRVWGAIDHFPWIRAVAHPDDRVMIAVRDHERPGGSVGTSAPQQAPAEMLICTECGHEHPPIGPPQMV